MKINSSVSNGKQGAPDMKLFLSCFLAMVTTSFAFILRALTLPRWQAEFNLTNTQVGEIAGVGLWPYAISIVLFSLIIDKMGYKNAMIVGFICHVTSAALTFFADGYTMLYIATFIMALGNGTIEATINPTVSSMFPKTRTKWLNVLHAGWPTGLVLGGMMALFMGPQTNWRLVILLVLLPALAYLIILLPRRFPVNDRVKAGVPYLDMLKEVGVGGALIIIGLIIFQIGSVLGWTPATNIIVTLAIVAFFGFHVRSFGQPLFIILLLLMLPLAITELGTDSWISDLMTPAMSKIGLSGGWILIYTSAIMVVLRLSAGSFIHRVSPVRLLIGCSIVAALGLLLLSSSEGIMLLVAATVFGLGKSLSWPTMLGIIADRFPKGGALTLNLATGVGMIGAGVIGAVILGFVQDKTIYNNLNAYDVQNKTTLSASYLTQPKSSIFGNYTAIDLNKRSQAPQQDKKKLLTIEEGAKKGALKTVVLFPLGMLLCYLGLLFYFKSKGGYKVVLLPKKNEQIPAIE
jgi:MFS family permease